MSVVEELLESRRVAVAEASGVWELKVAADAAKAEADSEWVRAWKRLMDAGFSERELRSVGMVPPGEVSKGRKPRARRAPAPVEGPPSGE